MRKALLSAAAIAIGASISACTMTRAENDEAMAGEAMMAPPGGDYQMVSELVALPEFLPGLGTLYVQPDTLPAGPFLAYDRTGKLVSTIYMIPLDDIEAQEKFDGLEVGESNVEAVDMYYNAGHPGVEEPHYHVVLWHVPEDEAQLQ
jgi:hypothetical protein